MRRTVLTVVIFVLFVLAVSSGVIALKPRWRNSLQLLLIPHHRQVIATAYGRFVPEKGPLKAVKSVDKEGVFVEIFNEDEKGELTLFATIRTTHPQDGQFNFKGRMSHLVASDVDGDGRDELLVPSFDQKHRPRLNVYKYQPELNEFQEVSSSLPAQ